MDPILSVLVLYLVGLVFLVAEIFLPSHGLLTIGAVVFLLWALTQTFRLSETAGYTSLLLLAVIVPTIVVFAVRNWHRTPFGRRIAPPNPVLTREDVGARQDLLQPYVGRVGTSVTPLRPVGECRFGDDKVECVAESGMIPRGSAVKAVGIVNMSLVVRLCDDERKV